MYGANFEKADSTLVNPISAIYPRHIFATWDILSFSGQTFSCR